MDGLFASAVKSGRCCEQAFDFKALKLSFTDALRTTRAPSVANLLKTSVLATCAIITGFAR